MLLRFFSTWESRCVRGGRVGILSQDDARDAVEPTTFNGNTGACIAMYVHLEGLSDLIPTMEIRNMTGQSACTLESLGSEQTRCAKQQRDTAVHTPTPNTRPDRGKDIILLIKDEDEIIHQPILTKSVSFPTFPTSHLPHPTSLKSSKKKKRFGRLTSKSHKAYYTYPHPPYQHQRLLQQRLLARRGEAIHSRSGVLRLRA